MHLSSQNVQPSQPSGAPAPAAPQGAPGVAAQGAPAQPASSPSPITSLLPLLIFVPIIYMMFRRNKKEQEARGKLKKGDRIASQSGLVGELMELDERFAKVKLGPGNTVTMLASSLMPLDPTPAAKSDDKDLKDLKEAKAAADKK